MSCALVHTESWTMLNERQKRNHQPIVIVIAIILRHLVVCRWKVNWCRKTIYFHKTNIINCFSSEVSMCMAIWYWKTSILISHHIQSSVRAKFFCCCCTAVVCLVNGWMKNGMMIHIWHINVEVIITNNEWMKISKWRRRGSKKNSIKYYSWQNDWENDLRSIHHLADEIPM